MTFVVTTLGQQKKWKDCEMIVQISLRQNINIDTDCWLLLRWVMDTSFSTEYFNKETFIYKLLKQFQNKNKSLHYMPDASAKQSSHSNLVQR